MAFTQSTAASQETRCKTFRVEKNDSHSPPAFTVTQMHDGECLHWVPGTILPIMSKMERYLLLTVNCDITVENYPFCPLAIWHSLIN